MRIHPRETLTNLAASKIHMAVLAIWHKYDLTYAVILTTLASVQAHYLREMSLAEKDIPEVTLAQDQEQFPGACTTIAMEIQEIIGQHGLTHGEILRCLNEQMGSMIRYVIREERHPEQSDLPGGLEALDRIQKVSN